MYEKFISSKDKLKLVCHEHFQEMRRQLDLHRESFKEKIDDIYLEMIDQTKEFETSYLNIVDEKLNTTIASFEMKIVGSLCCKSGCTNHRKSNAIVL